MKKIHMRVSVELEVSEEIFEYLRSKHTEGGGFCDIEYSELLPTMQYAIIHKMYRPCDWDNYGYIPGVWFETDYNEQCKGD